MSDNINSNNDNNDVNDVNDVMLTTLDNPFNPFSQYNEWFSFDIEKGYNTCSYLAEIGKTSDELSEKDEAIAIEKAIDEIIMYCPLGNYIKVTKESFKERFKGII